jgi:hypothetical protein
MDEDDPEGALSVPVLYQYSSSSSGSGCSIGSTVAVGITINPIEYWPWNPGDGGGPYYDTTTGEKIRN